MAAGQLLRPSLPRVDAGALTKPAQCRLACLGQRARRQHTSLAGRAAASSADLAAVTADEKAAPLGEPAVSRAPCRGESPRQHQMRYADRCLTP